MVHEEKEWGTKKKNAFRQREMVHDKEEWGMKKNGHKGMGQVILSSLFFIIISYID